MVADGLASALSPDKGRAADGAYLDGTCIAVPGLPFIFVGGRKPPPIRDGGLRPPPILLAAGAAAVLAGDCDDNF